MISGTYRIGFLDSLSFNFVCKNPVEAGGGVYIELPPEYSFEGDTSSVSIKIDGVSKTFDLVISGASFYITNLFTSDYVPNYENISVTITEV